jgi:chemotaxis protein methyltransferase CheR
MSGVSSAIKENGSTGPRLSDNEYRLVSQFVAQHFGIHFSEEKRWLLETRLSRLIEKRGFATFLQYYQHLVSTFFVEHSYLHDDIVDLIEVITNHETYFMREVDALELARDLILKRFGEQQEPRMPPVRVLSAGCSTGEEAYGLAILLSRLGGLDLDFTITGIDLDTATIKRAMTGIYSQHSFRGLEESGLRSQFMMHFEMLSGPEKPLFQIKDGIRNRVSFHQVNILDWHGLSSLGTFDVVLCRNVLIYFDETSRQRAIDNLTSLLATGGFLFLGHSENLIGAHRQLELLEINHNIFYRKN